MAAPSTPLSAPALTRRALNRATLHRQLLLAREPRSVLDTVTHLAGMQAQAPLAPHVGLWTRLVDYDPAELDALYEQRTVLRASLMRATVHLVAAADALAWQVMLAPISVRSVQGAFGKALAGVDTEALARTAEHLLTDAPRTTADLGRLLAGRFPGYEPAALAYGARGRLGLVQVTPRGQWGAGAGPAHTTIAAWLGRAPGPAPTPDGIFLRYLAAFGPAGVADAQQWSGLTRLSEAAERLRPQLRVVRDEDGRELFDLPDAPRPDPDTPAPVRFLPAYDNLLLSYADRSRVIVNGRRPPLPPGNGSRAGTVLVDGLWHGIWKLETATTGSSAATGKAVLTVTAFGPVRAGDREQIEAEGVRLVSFVLPDAAAVDAVIAAEA
ncbi:MAG TPA: winged helix DNA-binding domain-containing protein [Actinocrinis sp.]|nr:winged helix DNA-binding domain-containing protein [Actinocrinis sp.]